MANTLESIAEDIDLAIAQSVIEPYEEKTEAEVLKLWQDVQDRLDLIAATSKPTH